MSNPISMYGVYERLREAWEWLVDNAVDGEVMEAAKMAAHLAWERLSKAEQASLMRKKGACDERCRMVVLSRSARDHCQRVLHPDHCCHESGKVAARIALRALDALDEAQGFLKLGRSHKAARSIPVALADIDALANGGRDEKVRNVRS